MPQLTVDKAFFRSPQCLLLVMTAAMAFMFSVWNVLLNNFVIERANFTGAEIGMLQSLREVPGFLAFTAVFVLLIIKEQRFAFVSLMLLGVGVSLTGMFPSVIGLYCTTVLMSIGFHYYETLSKSLTLQWIDKGETAHFMGKMISAKSAASLIAYGMIFIAMSVFETEYLWVYMLAGVVGVVLVAFSWWWFPHFKEAAPQHKKLILRRRYSLYYALVFLSGARRQIFIVFAGFMMVEKFGYTVPQISLLFIVTYVFNLFMGPWVGKLIAKVGERNALVFEYVGLVAVFTSYAFVQDANVAAALYIIDHLFFAFAIAMSTYFQKIADPKDIAATASVSFTINHIAAVFIPALLGLLWLQSPKWVFLIGSGFAVCSLVLSVMIPRAPEAGKEVIWAR